MAQDIFNDREFVESALSILPGMVYVFNQQTQANEYVNRSLGSTLGFSPEEIQQMGASMMPTLSHPDDHIKIADHFEKIKRLADGEIATLEYRVRHKNGAWVWLVSHDKVLHRAPDGSVLRHIGHAIDVTRQKQQEAQEKEVRQEFELIFNAATSGIVALNGEGQIVRLNTRARHMLGGLSDPVPFPWPEDIRFLEPEKMQPLDASADPVQRVLSGHRLNSETHLMRRLQDGEDRRYVRVDSAAVEVNIAGVHSVLVIDDVSNEERNRQVVERKNRLDALGQLTGGIAHDFNNLLASLLYAIELAGKSSDLGKRQSYLEVASMSIDRGRSLTNRLLAFARQQPGLASVRKTSELLSDFEKLIRPMLEEHIEIKFTLEDPEIWHFCDQVQLETAIMNLVLSSRDAILRSGVGNLIEICARPVRASTMILDEAQQAAEGEDGSTFRYVEISVSDNGPGMDDETLARCTDPFFTTKETNSGTGLGLPMVYGFVRQSDGDLRVYSEEGIGTNVQMTLPRGSISGVREEPMPQDTAVLGSGQTILVVEDEFQLLIIMTDVLEDLGYVVVSANSGGAALEMVEQGEPFDLLLTDVVMPGKVGGFELARRIRALRPDVPVIYTSGYTGFTAQEMGEVQAPLLQKPAPPAELARAIATALAARPKQN